MKIILLVEDDNQTRGLIEKILTEFGYMVIQAADGKLGIELYNTVPIDLVITDLLMPEKDGLELITDLRRINPQVKIIAISGGGIVKGSQYLKIAEAFGAQGLLPKPFQIEELSDLVKKVLEG